MDFGIIVTHCCLVEKFKWSQSLKIRGTLFLRWDFIQTVAEACFWLNLARYYLEYLIKTKLDRISQNEITFLMRNMLDKVIFPFALFFSFFFFTLLKFLFCSVLLLGKTTTPPLIISLYQHHTVLYTFNRPLAIQCITNKSVVYIIIIEYNLNIAYLN